MTLAEKREAYETWAEGMAFLQQLIGEKFHVLKKLDGTPEDDTETLWNWYQNYNNNLAKELRK